MYFIVRLLEILILNIETFGKCVIILSYIRAT